MGLIHISFYLSGMVGGLTIAQLLIDDEVVSTKILILSLGIAVVVLLMALFAVIGWRHDDN